VLGMKARQGSDSRDFSVFLFLGARLNGRVPRRDLRAKMCRHEITRTARPRAKRGEHPDK
jgi:hypothetical protein